MFKELYISFLNDIFMFFQLLPEQTNLLLLVNTWKKNPNNNDFLKLTPKSFFVQNNTGIIKQISNAISTNLQDVTTKIFGDENDVSFDYSLEYIFNQLNGKNNELTNEQILLLIECCYLAWKKTLQMQSKTSETTVDIKSKRETVDKLIKNTNVSEVVLYMFYEKQDLGLHSVYIEFIQMDLEKLIQENKKLFSSKLDDTEIPNILMEIKNLLYKKNKLDGK
jgi:hypothetical protein